MDVSGRVAETVHRENIRPAHQAQEARDAVRSAIGVLATAGTLRRALGGDWKE